MGLFGFIENFFFISLALVFVLVLLLVYHFKNRITVAEKKSESMYGLLTAVVKEIKTLRGMFGLGGGSPPAPVPQVNTNTSSQFEVKSKTTPEIPSLSETKPGLSSNELREVITLDFSKPENKIVVSDVEDEDSDDEEDEESDESSISDDDEGEDSDDDDDDLSIKEVKEEVIVLTEEDVQSGAVEVNLQEVDLDSFYQPTIDEAPESAENEIETTLVDNILVDNILVDNILVEHLLDETSSPVLNIHPQEPQQPESVEEVSFSQDNEQDNALLTFDVSPQTQTPAFQIDQLRKMNINQLKTIASQIGITADISKMKKPELISLIQSH